MCFDIEEEWNLLRFSKKEMFQCQQNILYLLVHQVLNIAVFPKNIFPLQVYHLHFVISMTVALYVCVPFTEWTKKACVMN